MYEGKAFSPPTALTNAIGSADTVIEVDDISVFPPAPNIATIYTDGRAETIRYAAIAGNTLSGCVRGFEGTPQQWDSGDSIGRNFTDYDYGALVGNINALNDASPSVVFSKTRPTGNWRIWIRDMGEVPGYPDPDDSGNHSTPYILETAPLDAPGDFAVMGKDGTGETVYGITDDPQAPGDNLILTPKST